MSIRMHVGLVLGMLGLAVFLPVAGVQAQTDDSPSKRSANAKKPASTKGQTHKVAFQVNQNDPAVMNLTLNNVKNIIEYYAGKGEKVAIEVVTYGPGLHMLRSDTSPVKDRVVPMALEHANLTFVACANTQANQSKAEGKPVPIMSEAKIMPSGVVRLMELQALGYAYIRP